MPSADLLTVPSHGCCCSVEPAELNLIESTGSQDDCSLEIVVSVRVHPMPFQYVSSVVVILGKYPQPFSSKPQLHPASTTNNSESGPLSRASLVSGRGWQTFPISPIPSGREFDCLVAPEISRSLPLASTPLCSPCPHPLTRCIIQHSPGCIYPLPLRVARSMKFGWVAGKDVSLLFRSSCLPLEDQKRTCSVCAT